ncbi:hypothetical protein [Nocardia jinanensis]|uniref:Uncharacterized protein n=1 Tax=Nocardia jinanensis TaxID=382504 RepID=A0A917W0C1_9NOCA|nr:hypothetical protein [Nocardia jinanensis]GGL46673.1 hypothetical protein GCM10011588_71900 [Nocardia jinanensis]
MHRFPGQDTNKAPHDIACHVESLLDEQARVVDELMSAETAYIEAVAEAQRAGLLSRGELSEAYTRLHSWGISNFSNRWRRLVGVVPEQLRAAPVATPPGIEPLPATRMPPVDTYGR